MKSLDLLLQDRLLTCPQCGKGKNFEISEIPFIQDCEDCMGKIQVKIFESFFFKFSLRPRKFFKLQFLLLLFLKLDEEKSIEVGHTFLLGDKYSKVLSANYTTKEGKPAVLQMGCYGLGLSR